MTGKKNVVFGFIYLALSAVLGPYMLNTYYGDVYKTAAAKQKQMSKLEQFASNDYMDQELNKMSGEQIARANTKAILSLSQSLNSRTPINSIKGGPHAHGTLEAILNIVAGIALAFIAVSPLFKQIISWMFIVGTVLHSGMLYFALALNMGWAQSLLGSPVSVIGPGILLCALILMAVAAYMGFGTRAFKEE